MLAVKSSIGGFTSPYVYVIPADTVIFYNATYSAPVENWSTYTDAVGKFIVGTATQIEVAAVTAASGSSTATGTSLSTAGSHSGGSVPTPGGYVSINTSRKAAGEHTHAITAAGTASTELKPIATNITVLRTTTTQQFFPANTIHINATNLVSGTQKLAATSNRYIACGTSVADIAATTHTMTLTAALYNSGSHGHSFSPHNEYGSTATSSLQTNWTTSFTSNHTHVVTATAVINALKGKLLKLWVAAARRLPANATIVMYCGNISLLPSYWKICDGTNGTVDMREYFLGYATSALTDHGAVTSETNTYTYTGPTVATDPYAHRHFGTGTSYYTSAYRNHGDQVVTHAHAVAGGVVSSTALPAYIKLAFIQLVI